MKFVLKKWYLGRLKSMGLREILYRLANSAKAIYEKKFSTGLPLETISVQTKSIPLPTQPKMISDLQAIRLLDFELDPFETIDFNRDPVTKKSFPLRFSRDIDIRFAKDKSAKRVWEINRLQFLPLLALQAKSKKENFKLICTHIDAWQKQNPYLLGVNWYSTMEVGLRLISFFLTWKILDFDRLAASDARAKYFCDYIFLPTIYRHMKHVNGNFSKYSSANNHLIVEAASMYVASVFWRFKESPRWQRAARNIIEGEIKKQHSKNGVNREEASHYARFVFDALSLSLLAGRYAEYKLSTDYKKALVKIAHFLESATNPRGELVRYGDNDDGRFLPVEFQPKIFSPKPPRSVFYENEGHFFLKNGNNKKNIFLHFNAGALGYLSIAAHGHADALSVTCDIDGLPYIVESGTYTYHADAKWREYFVSTLAHNTIRINQKDQAEFIGPTLWSKKYKTKVISANSNANLDEVIADCYDYSKSRHRRHVLFDKKSDKITIADEVKTRHKGTSIFEFCLHLHPEIKVKKLTANVFILKRRGGRAAKLVFDKGHQFQLIQANAKRPIGWYSPKFLVKILGQTIYGKIIKSGKLTLNTTIEI